ncbi:hypothetical protein EPUS_04633 [Endocarpon pusillum Z07020]|uniref:glutaminase n=1 Tax=Endocarpon pusillum (strain Z07020 / HMAS-L-300199) TaxID=1263415 RepID=U1HEP2_ENDPU|nr:uncharacterized protein EPUS_04633 [Endocarpon pusillum Z07020]ERF68535.1 hypothetical protein EPUS_04633 [Endocarpon pusillum Z07020]
MNITVGVLALQGAFREHLHLLQRASEYILKNVLDARLDITFVFHEIRTAEKLSLCDALIIPGGESTTISLVAARSNLLEPLRDFVKLQRKPTWGTCAGLILLAESANRTKQGGQELIGGLDVRVNRNHFGRQVESFVADLDLPFLHGISTGTDGAGSAFQGIFIRAPVVERILPHVQGEQKGEEQRQDTVIAPLRQAEGVEARRALSKDVEVLGLLPDRIKKAGLKASSGEGEAEAGDIIAVRQGNVFGTSFHPELTGDIRIHVWWLRQLMQRAEEFENSSLADG